MSNVPQDVIETIINGTAINSHNRDDDGLQDIADRMPDSRDKQLLVKAIKLLRAQRSNAEPDVVFVADYYGESLLGKYDAEANLYFMPDGDGYTKKQLAEFDAEFFYTAPPAAGVAAGMMKAAEICHARAIELTPESMSEALELGKVEDAIRNAIPADGKAALRDLIKAGAKLALECHYGGHIYEETLNEIADSVLEGNTPARIVDGEGSGVLE